MDVRQIDSTTARATVEREHYLHRKPNVRYAFGLFVDDALKGVVTFGQPASQHLLKSVSPGCPDAVVELNRLWADDDQPANTESQFVGAALRSLPALIVVSFADTAQGHFGYIYRALNFNYAGWTDMERLTPRVDYKPIGSADGVHSRSAFRDGRTVADGGLERVPRSVKVRYWITTGNKTERKFLNQICAWPIMDWRLEPPPSEHIPLSAYRNLRTDPKETA